MDARVFAIYLNDHLALVRAERELLQRLLGRAESSTPPEILTDLQRDLEEDALALEQVLDRLGVATDPLKQGAAWLAEKLGRLKPNGALMGRTELAPLIELETLRAGAATREDLWELLLSLFGEQHEQLALVRPQERLARARKARERLAPACRQAARRAFRPVASPAPRSTRSP